MTVQKQDISKEEQLNVITHGYGALLSVLAFILLLYVAISHGEVWRIVGTAIYGSSLVLMFTISTIMHILPPGEAKKRFVMYDHMSIYIFIAGTYTPFLLVVMRNTTGYTALALIWLLALAGILYKRTFTGRYMWFSTLWYLIMGWGVAFLWNDLANVLGPTGLWLLLIGGISYTLGIIFFVWETLKYHHGIWHIFVLAGAALHYGCIYIVMLS